MKLDRVRVITEMARNGISCKDLVEKTGLSRITVTNVRSGKNCTRSTAFAIASAIGVDVSEILEVENKSLFHFYTEMSVQYICLLVRMVDAGFF